MSSEPPDDSPPKAGFWEALARDRELYDEEGGWVLHLGFWAGATYRLGARAREIKNPPLQLLARCATGVMSLPWRAVFGVVIPTNVEIGPGLRIPHPRNIIVYPGTRIGRDCSLYQETTIGKGPVPGVPELGDEVIVFPGARVLGGVRVGERARIGANVVVSTNVAPDSSVSVARATVVDGSRIDRIRQRRDSEPSDGNGRG